LDTISYIFKLIWILTGRPTSCVQSDYEVPGMVLLCYLKGVVRLDRSKDMSVHVSTCTSYDLNAFKPVVWKLWRW